PPTLTAFLVFFFPSSPPLPTQIYTLSLHDALPISATPGTAKDGMIGILRDDHFLVRPTNDDRACTVESVASHTLYEKSHPYSVRSEEHTSELQSRFDLVCRLLLEKKKKTQKTTKTT